MNDEFRVPVERLRAHVDPASLRFETTDEIADDVVFVGQQRAREALEFALNMRPTGYNVFVAGAPGTGKSSAVRAILDSFAPGKPVPADWCYVHNFRDPSRPRSLKLAAGQARKLRNSLVTFVRAARRDIPRAFESEEYVTRREAIMNELNRRREGGMAGLSAAAQAMGFLIQVTPVGIALVPLAGDRPMSDEEIARLTPEMRQALERSRTVLDGRVYAFLKEMRAIDREARDRLETHDREVALNAVGGLVEDLLDDFPDQPEIVRYLEEVREGVLSDIPVFRGHPLPADQSMPEPVAATDPDHLLHERALRKYEVNVLVDNADCTGAPVIVAANPTYPNLIGRIEREALLGALVTDFTLIAAGALHQANGGYLVLRAEDLFRMPMAWDGLKRALRERAIAIEDVTEAIGMATARGLRPDPIPLDAKVIVVGEPAQYGLLHAVDPDFAELFRVRADFDFVFDRNADSEQELARFTASVARRDGAPFSAAAVALVIEEASRIAADQRKLTARLDQVADLIREASYWASRAQAAIVDASHVRQAIDERRRRSGLAREHYEEAFARQTIVFRPEGRAIGQISGLSVVGFADQAFGHPSRITATVGLGREGLVDIERQVEFGGPIHSKGVLIVGGYLLDQYARDKPLALTARIVFEQSYGPVDGDSASLAELLVLLSRIGDIAIDQTISVTGSINQRGEVQAIGGVNEKIEGYFDACRAVGLAEGAGVIIPESNASHVMLREDVLAAVAAGTLSVYTVRSVDDALQILTGLPAGGRDSSGAFPEGSVHGRVDAALWQRARALQSFGSTLTASQDGLAGSSAEPVQKT